MKATLTKIIYQLKKDHTIGFIYDEPEAFAREVGMALFNELVVEKKDVTGIEDKECYLEGWFAAIDAYEKQKKEILK